MIIKTIGVVGCGLMGGGITQVAAQNGYCTIVREASDELLEKSIGRIDSILAGNVAKGKITEDGKAEVLGRITGTTEFAAFGTCDLLI
jgi:3-hydroxybutyryl-CoA dehydrogenase